MYPVYASNFVQGVDSTFRLIIAICLFFLVLITGTMILFVIKYRKAKHPKAVQVKDSNALEVIWIVIPTLLVLLMFYYGFVAYRPMTRPPKDALVVTAIARMWEWSFEYQNGKLSPVLVVPLNKPVRVNLVSKDVIHSLFVPAFRIKQDVVPGKDNFLWFIPQQLGEYELLCSEYCGLRHSYMESKVIVLPVNEFAEWLKKLPSVNEIPAGLTIVRNNACTGCHSLDGSKFVSVSFKGLYNSKQTVISDGKERNIIADSVFIKKHIYYPEKDVVKGYSKGIMKSYKGIIPDSDVNKIISYLETLK